jgi:CDP-glucose 4,6-dehydratase
MKAGFMNYTNLVTSYKNKKIFLTGHTGFKGTWLLSWLNILGANVKGFSLEPTEKSLYNAISGNTLCDSIIGDIRDGKLLEKSILDFQPDFIFHLAAQPLVRLSYENPSETFAINAIGTANLLDAVRLLKNPCNVIIITTDKVYENMEWQYPYRENDRLGGYDPYSASKACAELVVSSYRNSFFNENSFEQHQKSIATARAGNVIGGGDWAKDRIIPDTINALSLNQPIEVRNPNAVRPWQHVLESLNGYLHLGKRLVENPIKFSDSWNFGPNADDNLTVETLVKIAIETWGSGDYIKPIQINQPHEAGLLKLDISKTVNALDWSPQYNSLKAITKTIEWYKQYNLSKNSAKFLVDKDILEFINE